MGKYPKPYRVINLELMRKIGQQPCFACGKEPWPGGRNDAAHLQTRKSGGPDSIENVVALCRDCHGIQHRIGIKSFVDRYKLPVTWESGWPRRADLIDES